MPELWHSEKIWWFTCARHSEAYDNVYILKYSFPFLFYQFIDGSCTELIPAGRYPSLRVAYIDEVEETNKGQSKKMVDKVYYSALVKAVPKSVDSNEPVENLDQVWFSEFVDIGLNCLNFLPF